MPAKKSPTVEEFLKELDHPLKAEILEVRKIILSSTDQITEQIKWNGPSFCFKGDDRVTFRLHPPKNIQLIFHRGAKVRKDVKDFSFKDPTGFIKWATNDRGVVTLADMKEIKEKKKDLALLVDLWMKATMD